LDYCDAKAIRAEIYYSPRSLLFSWPSCRIKRQPERGWLVWDTVPAAEAIAAQFEKLVQALQEREIQLGGHHPLD
jgi:hypothetical protein